MIKHYDVIVVGNGIVGATMALLLAKNTSLSIAIIDEKIELSSWDQSFNDPRVSAISPASKTFFQQIKVWPRIIEKRLSPYTQMRVFDEEAKIHFSHQDYSLPALGYIIEHQVMQASLQEEMQQCPSIHILSSHKFMSLTFDAEGYIVELNENKKHHGKLIIAADGAHSQVREFMQIEMKTWDYGHTAIVATVKTELSHNQTAWQRFLPEGPLAFLPLNDEKTSSIVWSVSHSESKRLLALKDQDFLDELTTTFRHQLGQVLQVDKRFCFPLRMQHVEHYILPHLALIGDAAHTIHPLAGQGVNMGLQDAVCLAEVIAQAVKKCRRFSHLATLRRYERSRKRENMIMLAGIECLKRGFASQNTVLQSLRRFGMNSVDKVAFLKTLLAHHAIGKKYVEQFF